MNAIAPAVMQDLVTVVKNGAVITTSLKVAEAFSKRHDNVLRKIETLGCSAEFNALNFEAVDYIDMKGEQRKAWNMTKDGFMFLVMGFSGVKAAMIKEAYIGEFNRMARELEHRTDHEVIDQNSLSKLPFSLGSDNATLEDRAKELCRRYETTRFIFDIHPMTGKLRGSTTEEGLPLSPVPEKSMVISLNNREQLQYMLDFMTRDELIDLIRMGLAEITRRADMETQRLADYN